MIIPCPKCMRELDIDERYAGNEVTCGSCDYVFVAPPIPGREPSRFAPGAFGGLISYAGFWKRGAAAFIDLIVLVIAGTLLSCVFGALIFAIMSMGGADAAEIEAIGNVFNFIVGPGMNWIYFALFESSTNQATPGKIALGIAVADLDGNRISFVRASVRHWGKFFSALIFFIGFFMAAFTDKKQALHDMMAGCLVINR